MNLWFYILLIVTVFWFVFMTWLSHQNGENTWKTSHHLAEELGGLFHDVDIGKLNGKLRRAAHSVVFAVLTVLVMVTMEAAEFGMQPKMAAGGLIALWAVIDEATKPLIQGRHFSWFDVRLNWLGVVIGALLAVAVKWILCP